MNNARKTDQPPSRKTVSHLYLRDAAVPVYEGETEGEALARATQEEPTFRARAEHLRRQRELGYPDAIPEEQLDAFLATLPSGGRRPTGRRATGESGNFRVRMPRRLHRELAEQAEREGVSLNTLVVAYLAREAGVRSVASP
jgi:hypothetical protein